MNLFLGIIAAAFVAATILPIWKHEAWWIRVFDFPRAQIAAVGLAVTVAYLFRLDPYSPGKLVWMAVLLACCAYQAVKMLPYTKFYPRQVTRAGDEDNPDGTISVLIANVYMENRDAEPFLEIVDACDPDIVLTVETDDWWVEQLSTLNNEYRYHINVPLSNTYGMQLHSRFELLDAEVSYLVDDAVPSIHTRIRLREGLTIRLHCLHPRPPAPGEDTDTVDRDAELLIVGRRARASDEPTIVMGDLNDVAWSHTTTLFQKISGLLDPRVGRGMFSTFHARYPFVRWPLDHLFHSHHFKVVQIERLPAWGSDHFPIFVVLQHSKAASDVHAVPRAGQEERKEASEKIEKAHDG